MHASREGVRHTIFGLAINAPPVLPSRTESLNGQTSRSLLYHDILVTQADDLGNSSAIALARTCYVARVRHARSSTTDASLHPRGSEIFANNLEIPSSTLFQPVSDSQSSSPGPQYDVQRTCQKTFPPLHRARVSSLPTKHGIIVREVQPVTPYSSYEPHTHSPLSSSIACACQHSKQRASARCRLTSAVCRFTTLR
jgi:hypothetical protein